MRKRQHPPKKTKAPPVPPKPRRGRPPRPKNKADAASPTSERWAVRPDEAARLIGVSPTKMKRMIADGTVESVKHGNARLVLVRSLKRLLGLEP